MATCPYCAENIPAQATICPVCGMDLTKPPAAARAAAPGSETSRPRKKTSTLVVTLLVLGGMILLCCPIGVALLLPAVQQGREAARRQVSQNNLKQIGLAAHNFHDTMNHFPPQFSDEERVANGQALHSWTTDTLPYLEQVPLYNSIDRTLPWDDAANRIFFATVVPQFHDPSVQQGPPAPYAVSHYSYNTRLWNPEKPMQFFKITDGTSNTVMAGTGAGNFKPWGDPGNLRDLTQGLNASPDAFGFPGNMKNRTIVLMSDGSVRVIADAVDPGVLKALGTPDGGEVTSGF